MFRSEHVKIFTIATSALAFIGAVSWFIYRVEAGVEGATIQTFEDAVWYTIVTLTTVGYGDEVPVSTAGHMIGYALLVLSLVVYVFLIGQISTIMSEISKNKKFGLYGTRWEDHAVIIGWNEFGRAVIDQLTGVGKRVALVTNKKDDIDLIREKYDEKQVYILYSDFDSSEVYEKCNIEHSGIVFVNLESDTDKLVYILNLKKYYRNLNYVVTLDNSNLKQTFQGAGVTHTISKNEIAGKLLASYMFEPDVAAYSEDIMSYPRYDGDFDIKQYKVLPANPFNGMNYGDAFLELKKTYNVILIGMTKIDESGKPKLMKNPSDDVLIEEGDYLLLILNGESFKKIKPLFRIEEGFIRS